jgi:hypothetical protein
MVNIMRNTNCFEKSNFTTTWVFAQQKGIEVIKTDYIINECNKNYYEMEKNTFSLFENIS